MSGNQEVAAARFLFKSLNQLRFRRRQMLRIDIAPIALVVLERLFALGKSMGMIRAA